MSSERIKAAAELLRTRAEGAGGNRTTWAFTDTSETSGGEVYANVTQSAWDVAHCPGGDTPPDEGRTEQAIADATYIAMMSPPVALALADWLDKYADILPEERKVNRPAYADLDQALALADAILGTITEGARDE